MRAGRFSIGKQAGEWITYDKKGRVAKVAKFKCKPPRKGRFTCSPPFL